MKVQSTAPSFPVCGTSVHVIQSLFITLLILLSILVEKSRIYLGFFITSASKWIRKFNGTQSREVGIWNERKWMWIEGQPFKCLLRVTIDVRAKMLRVTRAHAARFLLENGRKRIRKENKNRFGNGNQRLPRLSETTFGQKQKIMPKRSSSKTKKLRIKLLWRRFAIDKTPSKNTYRFSTPEQKILKAFCSIQKAQEVSSRDTFYYKSRL